jgi:hypothetical protein
MAMPLTAVTLTAVTLETSVIRWVSHLRIQQFPVSMLQGFHCL